MLYSYQKSLCAPSLTLKNVLFYFYWLFSQTNTWTNTSYNPTLKTDLLQVKIINVSLSFTRKKCFQFLTAPRCLQNELPLKPSSNFNFCFEPASVEVMHPFRKIFRQITFQLCWTRTPLNLAWQAVAWKEGWNQGKSKSVASRRAWTAHAKIFCFQTVQIRVENIFVWKTACFVWKMTYFVWKTACFVFKLKQAVKIVKVLDKTK